MAVDAAGNVYLAGEFSNTLTLGTTTLISQGGTEVFVAKWNPVSGTFLWAHRAGGGGIDRLSGIALSGSNIYIVGEFNGNASFGGTTLRSVSNLADMYVAKFTDAGSFVWAKSAGGSAYESARALAVVGSSVYVAGVFASQSFSFGTNLNVTNAGSGSTEDVFVVKLTDAGATSNYVWAQRAGGTGSDFVSRMVASGGALYLAGDYYGATASFGSAVVTNPTGNNGNNAFSDMYIAKLNDIGNTSSFVWALGAGGSADEFVSSLAVSGTNVYLGGSFYSATATFGSISLPNPAGGMASGATSDAFVVKLTETGNSPSFVWAERLGGAGFDAINDVTTNGTGLYLTGFFAGSAIAFGPARLSSAGGVDIFVTKLLDTGSSASFAWTQQAGGLQNDFGSALLVAGTRLHVAGAFSSPASFGTQVLTGFPNNNTAFFASLTDATLSTIRTAYVAGVSLYPNPARNYTNVQMGALAGARQATISLRDGLGRIILTHIVQPSPTGLQCELDLDGLVPGVYSLYIETAHSHAVSRLVIQ